VLSGREVAVMKPEAATRRGLVAATTLAEASVTDWRAKRS
jgi:hypothetical protein